MVKIGKNVLESLTRSMYEDSRCIYREYVQNAADQIDLAREQHLEPGDNYEIHVRIFKDDKRIEIEDTATGVNVAERERLRDVATSQKQRGVNKGFRGIGRLGGLGYCSKLVFETSAKGENIKTILYWDASKMTSMIDDETTDEEASQVLDACTRFEEASEQVDAHYFRVKMFDVTDDRLLNVQDIRNYLSMVAPVEYSTTFTTFAARIKRHAKELGTKIDTYNVYVEGEQLYKAYTMEFVYKNEEPHPIRDIKFIDYKNADGNLEYWGWYSISDMPGQIKSSNIAYGMRLRSQNIQVGDENTCKKFFASEGDKRFAQYFYGEIFVTSKALVPDARRDYIRECPERQAFQDNLTNDFLELKRLCNEASDIRSSQRKIKEAELKIAKIESDREKGELSKEQTDRNNESFERLQQLRQKEQQKLNTYKNKAEQNGSPLAGFMFNEDMGNTTRQGPLQQPEISVAGTIAKEPEEKPAKNRLRTDGPLYNKFDNKEKNIINKVYSAIYTATPDENMREAIIKMIEKELIR